MCFISLLLLFLVVAVTVVVAVAVVLVAIIVVVVVVVVVVAIIVEVLITRQRTHGQQYTTRVWMPYIKVCTGWVTSNANGTEQLLTRRVYKLYRPPIFRVNADQLVRTSSKWLYTCSPTERLHTSNPVMNGIAIELPNSLPSHIILECWTSNRQRCN